jgi:hypothetical protein
MLQYWSTLQRTDLKEQELPVPSKCPRGTGLVFSKTMLSTRGPPLWSSGQSSWLQVQTPRFDSRRYQIFWEVMSLERELLGRKSSCSSVESREYERRDVSGWPRETLYSQKSALTSLTSGSRSASIVGSRGLMPRSLFVLCWSRGSHSDDYEQYTSFSKVWIQGCDAVYSCRGRPTFRGNVLPSASVERSKLCKKPVNRRQADSTKLTTSLQILYWHLICISHILFG